VKKDGSKPFLDHLEDLRKMLYKSIIALVVCMGLCLGFIKVILDILKHPLVVASAKKGFDMEHMFIATTPMSPLNTVLQTALIGGLILSLPIILFFVGQFLLPALTPREKKLLLPTFIIGGLLFLAGLAFCYFFILPMTLIYLIELGNFTGQQALWTLDGYLGFVVQLLIAFGVSFEWPLVLVILAKFGIVSKKFLTKYRRHSFLVIFIFTTCMLPTTDPFSLFAMAIPMYLMYEASIFFVGKIEKKRAEEEFNAWKADYGNADEE
jgi:sec-independent protein translocase protein TatC